MSVVLRQMIEDFGALALPLLPLLILVLVRTTVGASQTPPRGEALLQKALVADLCRHGTAALNTLQREMVLAREHDGPPSRRDRLVVAQMLASTSDAIQALGFLPLADAECCSAADTLWHVVEPSAWRVEPDLSCGLWSEALRARRDKLAGAIAILKRNAVA